MSNRDDGYDPVAERFELRLPINVFLDVSGLELDRTGREEFFNP
ncbi:MAG: hypothetical protein OXG15_12675 [Gammaproteobacteria bacterium]|nr:hypothetical protein [Gammaproteobacteria bacterium]